MEITVQTSQPVPGQQSLQKQGPQTGTPAIVVSEAKKINLESDGRLIDESLQESRTTEIEDKVSQLNDHMQNIKRNLEFTVDDRSGASVITISDTETGEVIRQFPSEEVLEARNAVDKIKGLLIETKA
jgi:flagellar protein FlaG